MHGEQSGYTIEAGSVTNRCRHCHHWSSSEPADNTGEGPFHPRDDDHSIGCCHPVEMREQAMQSGHPHVMKPVGNDPMGTKRERRFVSHWHIGGAGCHDQNPRLRISQLRSAIQHTTGRDLGDPTFVMNRSYGLHLGL